MNQPDPQPEHQRLVSANWPAKYLWVSRATLFRFRAAGRMPKPVKVGGIVRWRIEDVRVWVDAGCPPIDEWGARN